ncbi:MAG: RNA pseudouridine synthase, partial [Polyangiaceae bacterium]
MPAAPAPPEAPLPHPLDSLFPLLRPSRILLDDGDVLVIDKPFGLPTHETAPGDENHAVARLKALLRARGQGDYLGIHQRLDKDTSGVLLFSRNPDRNRALAAEIEGRKAKKEYLAAVVLPKTAPKTGTLRAFIEKEKGGAVSVHTRKPRSRGAQEAITHYRVIERRADRALLAVIPETGRMHQIRAQLAHAGWPVAGDPLYGGPPAPRLLLHAARLSLAHPSGKGRIDVSSTIPDTFARWLTADS